jgi:hypothetical protein
MQWVFTKISAVQEFNIYSRDILTMSKPNANLVEYYKETIEYFKKNNKITTTPAAGDIVLFPSNFLYAHAALPVEQGTKYSAVTMFDYNDINH